MAPAQQGVRGQRHHPVAHLVARDASGGPGDIRADPRVLPVLGMAAIAVPVYYLSKPGQDPPYSWFPYAVLAIVVVSIVYAAVLNRRDPALGDRVGSMIADE